LKDQKLIRSFYNAEEAADADMDDRNSKAVFDINWSHDGTAVAGGFEKSVVMLDMR